jgi:hypothetical protein
MRNMTISPNIRSLRVIALGLVGCAALALASGCGSQDSSASGSTCGSASITRSADGRLTAGGCAFDTDEAVDLTAFPRTSEAIQAVVEHAMRSADGTITHGGHLRVTVFGRVAARELVVYDGAVPTLGEQDEVDRGPTEASLRTAIKNTLRVVLNGAPANHALAKQIASLTKGGGTDVARAVRDAARARDGRPLATVVLTDGWHDEPGFRLASTVDGHGSLSPAVKHLVRLAGGQARAVGVLELSGLGYSPTRFSGNETSPRTDRLAAVWDRVCRVLHPRTCSINTDI